MVRYDGTDSCATVVPIRRYCHPALRQNLSNQNIGNVMKRLGFKKIHKKNGNGWAVIEKEGSEINNDSFIDPSDTVED
ncbi:hypothetical protein [Segatella copri]|uniref:hypothetical protein n=1 Tax=Segatella copri TaxID=165179 RepID=UPI003F8A2BF2